jgi:hypothetical protein
VCIKKRYSDNKILFRKRKHDYYKTLGCRFNIWRKTAKRKNNSFELTLEDIESWEQKCFYTGIELTFEPHKFNSISLDRRDNSKGYSKDNAVFCCNYINKMKSDLPYDSFIFLCKSVSKKIGIEV